MSQKYQRMQFIFRFCTFYILIYISSQENILFKERYKQAVFAEAPKHWFNYVRQLISRNLCLHGKHKKESSLVNFFNNCQNLVKLFFNMAKAYTLHVRDFLNNLKEFTNHLSKFTSVRKENHPMGFVTQTSGEKYSHIIYYHLDSNLMLNVTFKYIYIWNKHLSNCLVGSVTVIGHINGENSTFEYCGIHSGVVMYPPGKTVMIILNSESKFNTFEISLFFSIFDIKRINSAAIPGLMLKASEITYFQGIKQFLLRFLLLALKNRFLILRPFTKIYQAGKYVKVFDGPGIFSPILDGDIFITSTFQCIIIICLYSINDTSFLKELNYSSHLNVINKYLILKTYQRKEYSFSKTNFYILNSHGKLNAFINLTIVNLTYSGYNDPICTYAGLTAYNLISNTYVEISSECFSFDGFYRYRNMYSSSNDTLIVIYSYKEYGILNVSFSLSTTYCKVVSINMCALSRLCDLHGNVFCTDFLNEIKQLPDVKYVNNSKVRSFIVSLQFSVPIHKCFILQLTPRIDTLRIDNINICKLDELRHGPVYDSGTEIHHHVTAFLHGT